MDLHSLINNLYQQGQGPAGAGGAPASAGAASSSGGSGAASVNVQNFQQLLKKWDEGKANTPVYDPTEVLSEMADILEKVKLEWRELSTSLASELLSGCCCHFRRRSRFADLQETDTYLSKDPDPFEERHPSRVNPDCPFGLILKAFFKKESFVRDVFDNYLRENYFTRNGVASGIHCSERKFFMIRQRFWLISQFFFFGRFAEQEQLRPQRCGFQDRTGHLPRTSEGGAVWHGRPR